MIHKLTLKSDNIGALASSLCLLHCLATPLFFIVQPLRIHETSSPIWWKSLDFIFLILSFFAVYWSAKNTSKNWIKYLLWLSWAILTFAIVNEKLELFHLPELAVYIPTLALIVLHIYNKKYCQCKDGNCCANN